MRLGAVVCGVVRVSVCARARVYVCVVRVGGALCLPIGAHGEVSPSRSEGTLAAAAVRALVALRVSVSVSVRVRVSVSVSVRAQV